MLDTKDVDSISNATTHMSSPMLLSILEPLEVDEHLDIDPELVRILMEITEQDLTPTCPMHPLMGSDELACMRLSAEKDFCEWRERRKLERRSSRLSRHNSGDSAPRSYRKLSYRHTVTEVVPKKNQLCHYNSDPFHSRN